MSKLKNIAVAVASIVIFTSITNAQVVKASYSVKAEEPMAVKYVGNDGNYLTFEVSVEPTISTNALFEIADKNEGELYTSTLAPNAKTKTIKIEKREGQVLDFKLVVGKNTYTKSFSVNTNSVETTTVSESNFTIL
jgi:hypothetical protein